MKYGNVISDVEIERARRTLRSAKSKYSMEIMWTGIGSAQTLRLTSVSGQRDRAAAILTESEADNDLIMGKAPSLLRYKIREIQEARPSKRSHRGKNDEPSSFVYQRSDFSIPAIRPMREMSAEGATSFHFSHESVSKSRQPHISATGVISRPGAAKSHNAYLERPEAVARIGAANVPRSGDKQTATLAGENRPVLRGDYIERQEAMAVADNGVPVLFTNISPDPWKRQEYWGLVEDFENEPGIDKMVLRMADYPNFWDDVVQDSQCPAVLKAAINECDPSLPIRIETESNKEIRKLLARHGWKPPAKRPANETLEEAKVRKIVDKANASGAIFEDARGGRIQYRVIGELPHDLSHQGRINILAKFTQEFETRELPYVAVVHAPDHTNDDRNWHFHIAYHDQPAKIFTNDLADHPYLKKADGRRPSKKAQTSEKIFSDAIGSRELDQFIGQWDFTVPVQHKSASRNTLTAYPFAQPKNREVTRAPFIPHLRKRLADITNEELAKEGIERRLDHRRFKEMGIDREPGEHLGTKLAQSEAAGVPTAPGIANELKQWEWSLVRIGQAQITSDNAADETVKRWRDAIQLTTGKPVDGDRNTIITQWLQTQMTINEHSAIAEELDQYIERAESRARKIEATCKKQVEAIARKKASRRQRLDGPFYYQKLQEAQAHLNYLSDLMFDERITAETSRILAKKLALQNLAREAEIEEGIKADNLRRTQRQHMPGIPTKMSEPVATQLEPVPSVANRKAATNSQTSVTPYKMPNGLFATPHVVSDDPVDIAAAMKAAQKLNRAREDAERLSHEASFGNGQEFALLAPRKFDAAAIQARSGLHKSLDEWLAADQKNDLRARTRAAHQLSADPAGMALVKKLEIGTQRRLNRDAELHVAHIREVLGRGFERDRDFGL